MKEAVVVVVVVVVVLVVLVVVVKEVPHGGKRDLVAGECSKEGREM